MGTGGDEELDYDHFALMFAQQFRLAIRQRYCVLGRFTGYLCAGRARALAAKRARAVRIFGSPTYKV